ncbi:Serine aminopeptidase, S33 [Sesbania bispinosa]|nr:Serine aminopeptidase, S33 [Sesbania bispinosa]
MIDHYYWLSPEKSLEDGLRELRWDCDTNLLDMCIASMRNDGEFGVFFITLWWKTQHFLKLGQNEGAKETNEEGRDVAAEDEQVGDVAVEDDNNQSILEQEGGSNFGDDYESVEDSLYRLPPIFSADENDGEVVVDRGSGSNIRRKRAQNSDDIMSGDEADSGSGELRDHMHDEDEEDGVVGHRSFRVVADGFPSFLPREVERIKDPLARKLAMRIQRLPVPVRFSENPIMSSCVMPLVQSKEPPIVLLHGFDSSCLEWRYGYPLLEESGFETWAIDILGWGFCDLEKLPPCDVVSKREHFYQFWKSYIRRPMILVGPSLGSAVAIDFAVNYPEAVENLVLIDASVYAEGTGNLATLPRVVAYAGEHILSRHRISVQGYVQKSPHTMDLVYHVILNVARMKSANSLLITSIGGPLALFIALVG